MRIPSGVTDQYASFTAFDVDDYISRQTGLSGFTVKRCRNGGTLTTFTTPTVVEIGDGEYALLLDEDMTIDAGDDSQEMFFLVSLAGMVTAKITIELYRPKITAGLALTVESDGMAHADLKEILGVGQSVTDLKDFADAGYDPVTHKVQGVVLVDTVNAVTGLTLAAGTIGDTGNSTTTLHLEGLTFGNDEINDLLLVILDDSTNEYHSRWIADWVLLTELATVATLPFTPEDDTDTYWILPIRKDVSATLGTGAISSTTFAAGAITDAAIAANAFTAAKFASGAFDAVWTVATRTLTSISGLGIALATKLTKYVQLLARSDAAIVTDNATELTEINASGGSGAGDYSPAADSLEASQAEHDATQATLASLTSDVNGPRVKCVAHTKTTEGFFLQVQAHLDINGEVVDLSASSPAAECEVTVYEFETDSGGVANVTILNAAFTLNDDNRFEATATDPGLTADNIHRIEVTINYNGTDYTETFAFPIMP